MRTDRMALAEFPTVAAATAAMNRAWLEVFHDPGQDEAARRGARDDLIRRNIPLVVSVAKYFAGRGLDLPDLVQWGAFGLAEAIDRFDLGRPEAFGTYATHWIRCRITRAIREQGHAIRIPAHLIDHIARRRAGKPEHRPPVTGKMQMQRDAFCRKAEAAMVVLSIDSGRPGGRVLDAIPDTRPGPAEEAESSDDRTAVATSVAGLLRVLTPREAEIIRLRYGLDGPRLTLEEVGRKFGVTREWIRQSQVAAERKMRLAAAPPEVA
jgi:RNA polymerase primary sigma factor